MSFIFFRCSFLLGVQSVGGSLKGDLGTLLIEDVRPRMSGEAPLVDYHPPGKKFVFPVVRMTVRRVAVSRNGGKVVPPGTSGRQQPQTTTTRRTGITPYDQVLQSLVGRLKNTSS